MQQGSKKMTQNENRDPIRGVYTAIVTPFTKTGEIDFDSFAKLLEKQVDAKVDGVVIAGTTGESPTLTNEEKLSLLKFTKEKATHLKVMGGSGNNNTAQSVALSQQMFESGADSLLVVTPPYNKPSPEGLKKHFEAVAEATPLPICLYHVPGRTAQKLSSQVLASLCEIERVTSVKEASADLALFSDACRQSNADYLSGDDFTYLPSLSVGGKGVVSVVTNVFPEAFVRMTQLFQEGACEKATMIHDALFEFTGLLFCESNPAPTKFVLSRLGLCENTLRLPLVNVTGSNEEKIWQSYQSTQKVLDNIS